MGSIALCKTLFSPLRTEPNHRAEICSQLVFGECVLILIQNEDWANIKTEHGYLGWCRIAHLLVSDQNEITEILGRLTGIVIQSDRHSSNHGSLKIADFLPPYLQEGCFNIFPGQLPYSGLKWLFLNGISSFEPIEMVSRSNQFMGIPYLWGGKTPFGFDCSGFVQFLINLQGFSFPRDAWQQAEIGKNVPFDPQKPEFESGTLLYFQHTGKKIHHVALSTGGTDFVHASEWTRIQSFHPSHPHFAKERKNSLVLARELKKENLVTLQSSFTQLVNSANI